MLRRTILDVDDVVNKIDSVTCSDIRRVAAKHMVTDRLNMAVVGPCRGRKRLLRLLKL